MIRAGWFALLVLTMVGGSVPALAAAQSLPSAASDTNLSRPALVTAADSALEADVRAVASELRCVVCQGLSIDDSPSELAQQMRGLVREQLAAGKSREEVRRYFVENYGEWILLKPEAKWMNILVYLLPLGLLAAGLAVVVVAVRRWTSGAPAAGVGGSGAGAADMSVGSDDG